MDLTCKENIKLCPIIIDKVYDKSKALSKVNSNVSINFKLISKCALPRCTKIEIVESRFEYEILRVRKNILVNGHRVVCSKNRITDYIKLKQEYINLVDCSCDNLILNVIEDIVYEVKIKLKIKGIGHIGDCKTIPFEGVGESIDNVKTSIISNICYPNFNFKLAEGHLKIENDIIGSANPSYIFLSPIYDKCCNIESLLGNIFINYCISLDITSILPMSMNVLKCECNNKL